MQPELKLLWKKNVTWVFRVEVAFCEKCAFCKTLKTGSPRLKDFLNLLNPSHNQPILLLYTEICKKIHTLCEQ